MVETCEAEVVTMAGRKHSLMREEGERVRAYEFAHLFYAVAVANEFFRGVDIHAIVAGIFQRSAGNAHMHLCGSGLTKHFHDLEGSGSSHDGIIHQRNTAGGINDIRLLRAESGGRTSILFAPSVISPILRMQGGKMHAPSVILPVLQIICI